MNYHAFKYSLPIAGAHMLMILHNLVCYIPVGRHIVLLFHVTNFIRPAEDMSSKTMIERAVMSTLVSPYSILPQSFTKSLSTYFSVSDSSEVDL